jgi:hypothetical protein
MEIKPSELATPLPWEEGQIRLLEQSLDAFAPRPHPFKTARELSRANKTVLLS